MSNKNSLSFGFAFFPLITRTFAFSKDMLLYISIIIIIYVIQIGVASENCNYSKASKRF